MPPSTGSSENHSGKPHHVGTVSQMLDEGGEAPRSDIRDITRYRQLKLFYGQYYSFRHIHLITVVRSFGSVEMTDRQSSKPSFNPPSHQPSSPLSPRVARVLSTAVSTVGPVARSEDEHRDESAHRRQELRAS